MFIWKLIHKDSNTLANQVFKEQQKLPGPTWTMKTMEIAQEIGINEIEEIEPYKKEQWKTLVKKRIQRNEQEEFNEWAESSKKCNHMKNQEIKIKKYIEELNPNLARAILCIRLGMVETKDNYHAKFNDVICRNCKKETETTEHFIKCLSKEADKHVLEDYDQIYSLNDSKILKRVATKVYKILKNNTYFTYSG